MRRARLRFDDLTAALLRSRAQEYRAMADEAPTSWVRDEFYRIAAGLERVAEEKRVADRFRRPRVSELTADQLGGLARAYRDLAVGATTKWTEDALNRFATRLELMGSGRSRRDDARQEGGIDVHACNSLDLPLWVPPPPSAVRVADRASAESGLETERRQPR